MEKLLIFDFDGTIADTRADLALSVNLARKFYNRSEYSMDEVINFVGDGMRKLVQRAFKGDDKIDIDQAVAVTTRNYWDHLTDNTVLYDGVAEGLEKLKNNGHILAVLTNKPGDLCRRIAEHFGITGLFIAVAGGGDTPALKPDPESVRFILDRAREAGFRGCPDCCWMIGDNHTDLESASNAGIKSIFCTYGFGNRCGRESDLTVSSFAEIVEYFT